MPYMWRILPIQVPDAADLDGVPLQRNSFVVWLNIFAGSRLMQ